MGVPALFRWLSKKYPKIILPVVEEDQETFEGQDGTEVPIPIDYKGPNPNGTEFDNLYLDMNGIVHPCSHPEGKPAPETEEEMMLEIFKYTERVVNMVRPRKLLLMAIDGVAPRAKMNQQRSRRFRSAQEAKEKEEARKESLLLWESMGQTVTEDMRNKKSWDSNAITPGTPFMDLLARSLRYWVVQKMNSDPGWKDLEVIISDASVPGEGEHKIMDYIRRQRSNPGHDPNTQHVIYGLDADLIMLSLATHEPNFRVLREDVFFQDTSPTACRMCGQEGHYAAQCTGEKKLKADENDTQKKPPVKKPFIFLDVSILREYLEIELNVPTIHFFDFERAIDDWVLLIFFVGNDFLPHLPSLDIREGAIDTLLKIWKDELPRMGGYVTNQGMLEYAHLEIILEGLASREDDIFRRRKEADERQEQNAKRRKIENEARKNPPKVTVDTSNTYQPSYSGPSISPSPSRQIHALPPKPNFNSFEDSATSLGFGSVESPTDPKTDAVIAAIQGTSNDWLTKRREIRMANLSAAEMLKAEMMSAVPVSAKARQEQYEKQREAAIREASLQAQAMLEGSSYSPVGMKSPEVAGPEEGASPTIVSGDPDHPAPESKQLDEPVPMSTESTAPQSTPMQEELCSPQGVKRKFDDVELDGGVATEESTVIGDDEDDEMSTGEDVSKLAKKVNPDGSVEQEDSVKLYEPGYKERYYQHKFGVPDSDVEFKKKITTHYIEGMAWVLQYYYQGTPSWTWFYPFHFAPFAADFAELSKMEIKFDLGQPFKPFEQLMGVFPAASRMHIPEVFHSLMTDKDSPIIDFYPEDFEVDMNGKKMLWQGVAILPFIDEARLLEAMRDGYSKLDDEQERRNKWGNSVMFVADGHPLYTQVESLYAKRKDNNPVPIDPQLSKGMNGTMLPDPLCVPGSTYESPLASIGLPDIPGDCSLSALFFFPKQVRPHRSTLLPGVRRQSRKLTQEDVEAVGRRGRPRGRGRDAGFHSINSGRDNSRGGQRGGSFYGNGNSRGGYGGDQQGYGGYGGDRSENGRGYGGYGAASGRYGGGPPQNGPRGGWGGQGNSSYGSNYNQPPPSRSYPPPPSRGGYGGGGYGVRGGSGQYNSYNRDAPPPPQQEHGGYGGYGGGYQEGRGYGGNPGGGTSGYGRGGAGGGSGGYGGYGGYGQASGGGYGRGNSGSGYGGYGRGYTR